jgi:flagellar basal body L-ring protein FlgH
MKPFSVMIAAASLVLAASGVAAQTPPADAVAKPVDSYDVLLQQYLQEARAGSTAAPASLWMAGLANDLRARRVNDLLTVRVMENVSGVGSADSNLDKKSTASAGLPSLFGLESQLPGSVNPASLMPRCWRATCPRRRAP